MYPITMADHGRHRTFPQNNFFLFITALLVVTLSSTTTAINIGKLFKNNKDKASPEDQSALIYGLAAESDKRVQRKSEMVDFNLASTGTITQMEDGMERVPVTCNELMAKAVVTANEEKMSALASKDAALESVDRSMDRQVNAEIRAGKALDRVNDLEDELRRWKVEWANEIAELKNKMEGEMEETKQDAESKLDVAVQKGLVEVQDLSDRLVELESSTKEKIQAARERATEEINEANQLASAEIARTRMEAEEVTNRTNLEAETDMASARLEATDKMSEAEETVRDTKLHAEEEIARIETNCAATILQMKEDVAMKLEQKQEDTSKEIAVIVESADDRVREAESAAQASHFRSKEEIARVRKEGAQFKQEINANATSVIDDTVRESERKIMEMSQKVMAAQMEKQHALMEFEDRVISNDEKMDKTITEIRNSASENITKTISESEEKNKLVQREMNEMADEYEKKFEAVEKKTQERIAFLSSTSARRVEEILDSSEMAMADSEAMYESKLSSEEEHYLEVIQEWTDKYNIVVKERDESDIVSRDEIKRLKLIQKRLQGDFDAKVENLHHISEKLGKEYFNFTLIKQDSSRAIFEAHQQASHKISTFTDSSIQLTKTYIKQASDLANPHIQKAEQLTAPHVQKGWELYEEHLKEHVDTHVVPLLEIASPHVQRLQTEIAALTIRLTTAISSIQLSVARALEGGSSKTLKFMKARDPSGETIPEMVMDTIQYINANAERLVLVKSYLIMFIVAFLLRNKIFQFVSWIILLPVWISWFFCPLRALVGRKSGMEEPYTVLEIPVRDEKDSDKIKQENETARAKQGAIKVDEPQ